MAEQFDIKNLLENKEALLKFLYEDFELVDKDHTEENIAKVRGYHVSKGHIVPHYLDSRIERMYYR